MKSLKTAETSRPPLQSPGMMFVMSFFAMALANGLVLWAAHTSLPESIVLGTISLNKIWALVLPSATLSLIGMLALPFLSELENRRKKTLSPVEMTLAYFLINFVSVWLLTRFSEVFGLGVTSWVIVLGLAVALDIIQGVVMVSLQKIRLR